MGKGGNVLMEEDCEDLGMAWSPVRERCVPKKKLLLKQSYDIVTEETREGDVSESGWENEEGSEYETAEEIAEALRDNGVIEGGDTTYRTEGSQDMHTGEWRTDYYHIHGADKEDLKIIEKLMKSKGVHVY